MGFSIKGKIILNKLKENTIKEINSQFNPLHEVNKLQDRISYKDEVIKKAKKT